MPTPDDMTDAEADMVEQAKWGMSRTDNALVRLVRLVKLARAKLQDHEDRIRALEAPKP